MDQFFMGALALGSWVVGLFFLRFWRDTGDRLFGMFAASFWLFALTRIILAVTSEHSESRNFVYWIRLVAFVLILIAIVDKNRGRK